MSAARRDVLIVDGMFCAACAASVEAVLARQPGVASASVNFAADAAVVEWRSADHDPGLLLEAVSGLGYEPRLVGDGAGTQAQGRDPQRDLSMRLVIALFFGMWTMLPAIVLYLDVVTDPASRYGLALAAGLFSLPVVLYSGLPFYRMGMTTLRNGVAGIDALVTIGVAGSLVLSLSALLAGTSDVYFEVAIALITLQLISRLLDLKVRRKARDAVVELLDLAPDTMNLVRADGTLRPATIREVTIGDVVRVGAGDRIAVDGNVLRGPAYVDRSLLSGESVPVEVAKGDEVHAGEHVVDGTLDLEVTASAGKRRIDALARQVREMVAARPAWQRAADVVARHFLWLSALAAVLAALYVLWTGGGITEATVRALAVFVIACPCALSLALPIVGLTASAAAARRGIILRDLNALTTGADPERVFLDKTGTLTVGRPQVTAVHVVDGAATSDVLRAAAIAEQAVGHPIARAVLEAAAQSGLPDPALRQRAEGGTLSVLPGRGVRWRTKDERIEVGSCVWLQAMGIDVSALPPASTTRCGVARNGRLIGAIDLEDALRPGVDAAIEALRSAGLDPVILSGDAEAPVARIGAQLGCEAYWGLTPEDKVRRIVASREQGRRTAFAGDGLNDGPALAAADPGIAVGEATDAARSAAAVSFVDADVTQLPALFGLTRRARRIIRENLAWAIAYNAIAIPAAAIGWVHPAIAAVAMALSSVSVLLNALRAGAGRKPAVTDRREPELGHGSRSGPMPASPDATGL